MKYTPTHEATQTAVGEYLDNLELGLPNPGKLGDAMLADHQLEGDGTMTYEEQTKEARDYYALVDEARNLGIITSLDDPNAIRTVAELKAAVEFKRLLLPECLR